MVAHAAHTRLVRELAVSEDVSLKRLRCILLCQSGELTAIGRTSIVRRLASGTSVRVRPNNTEPIERDRDFPVKVDLMEGEYEWPVGGVCGIAGSRTVGQLVPEAIEHGMRVQDQRDSPLGMTMPAHGSPEPPTMAFVPGRMLQGRCRRDTVSLTQGKSKVGGYG